MRFPSPSKAPTFAFISMFCRTICNVTERLPNGQAALICSACSSRSGPKVMSTGHLKLVVNTFINHFKCTISVATNYTILRATAFSCRNKNIGVALSLNGLICLESKTMSTAGRYWSLTLKTAKDFRSDLIRPKIAANRTGE